MMFQLSLLLAAWIPSAPARPQSVSRGNSIEIPLIPGIDQFMVNWGPGNRKADHATVAMNDQRDIVVAFHSSRTDFTPELKQVEIAYFQFNAGTNDWSLFDQQLLGRVIYSPLSPPLTQVFVKCERPDVTAIGNRFWVVWTRRYDRNVGPSNPSDPAFQGFEPAVLECAWIEKVGTSLQISTNSAPAGLGLELDRHLNPANMNNAFTIRECAGVPDAVVLDLGDPLAQRLPTIGVVYPHQYDFGDYPTGAGDDTRRLTFRLVTCSIGSGNVITQTPPIELHSGIRFDGPTAPLGQESAGLGLPDLAPGVEPYSFWLTLEEQNGISGNLPLGRIRLEFWKGTSATGWPSDPEAMVSFGSLISPAARRRPDVDSYPQLGAADTASITFSRSVNVGNSDVVYEEWAFSPVSPGAPGAASLAKVAWPSGAEFPNGNPPTNDDMRPVVLHGRLGIRQCLVDRNASPCQLLMYSPINNPGNLLVQLASSINGLGRPAVAYRYDVASASDNYALTWEQTDPNIPPSGAERIWLRVD